MAEASEIEKYNADFVSAILGNVARRVSLPSVYPGYLAWRIKRALLGTDPERLIESVGDIRTIGDCRYAMTVTDHNGTEYEITARVK